jgi:hypothetical protein
MVWLPLGWLLLKAEGLREWRWRWETWDGLRRRWWRESIEIRGRLK